MIGRQGSAERLDDAYRRCQAIHRRNGRSYYLATLLLPAWKRRHVHALYALTRYTDDILDRPGVPGEPAGPGHAEAARRLAAWAARFYAALDGLGPVEDPVLVAVQHTIAVFGLDRTDFDAFFASMAMDLSIRDYPDYDALLRYMDGSAAVIGTLMLPILLAPDEGGVPTGASDGVREAARQLGLAFQLTNFIRDVAEDLRLGRVYLPAVDLERFGVGRAALAAASASPAVRRLIAFEIERARAHYRLAASGVAALPAQSRRCVRLAFAVYGGILGRIELAGYDVLAGRAVVPRRERLAAVVRELARPA